MAFVILCSRFCAGWLAGMEQKNPALVVCHRAIEPLQHAGRLDGFRRPVKVSAAIPAYVPDRLIPIQGQSSKHEQGRVNSTAIFQRTLPFDAP